MKLHCAMMNTWRFCSKELCFGVKEEEMLLLMSIIIAALVVTIVLLFHRSKILFDEIEEVRGLLCAFIKLEAIKTISADIDHDTMNDVIRYPRD